MFVFVLLQALLQNAESCTTYQYAQQHQTTVLFTKEFCAPPQVAIILLEYERSPQASFKFKITTITTIGFSIKLQCDSVPSLIDYRFSFLAFIDDRVLVFNDFLESITLIDGFRSKLIPYPIQNNQFEISYTITSYSGGSPNIIVEKQTNGFNLYVTGVDNLQLSGLGVQIIAGPTSIYQQFSSLQIYCSDYYNFMNYPIWAPTQEKVFAQSNIYDNTLKIFCPNGVTRDWTINSQGCDANNQIIKINLFIFDFKFQPHFHQKTRISNMMCLDYKIINTFNTQKLYFKEIQLTLSDLGTVLASNIEYQQENLSLVYSHQCQPNRKIIVKVLEYENDYTFSQYCHRGYNLITMYIYLYQSRVGLSELTLSLTLSGVSLQQKMMDSGDTFQLVNIEILN